MAIRSALGAGAASIARQLLTESLLLACLGGSAGLLGAFVGLRIFQTMIPASVPRAEQISIDGSVLAFTMLVTILTGLLFGALPAVGAARRNFFQHLKLGRTQKMQPSSAVGKPLIVFEIALSLVLLVGAGLLLKNLLKLLQDDFGLHSEHVLTARTLLPPERYARDNRARQFQQQLLGRVESLPGVEAAGIVSTLPLHSSLYVTELSVILEGQQEVARQELPRANYKVISPSYFDAMGIPLLAGRQVSEQDTEAAPAVVMVSNALARRFWPGENAVGRRISTILRGGHDGPWRTVVGVVGDVRLRMEQDYEPLLYLPTNRFLIPKGPTIPPTSSTCVGAIWSRALPPIPTA